MQRFKSVVLFFMMLFCIVDSHAANYALLIGVSEYPELRAKDLGGPKNDVRLVKDLLLSKGFEQINIDVLASGVKGAKDPTKKNITKSLDNLSGKTDADLVFIFFSGHGSQVFASETAGNTEPDGLDEVFLPMDVEPSLNKPKNYLSDDEIGAFLKSIAKNAKHVLVLFDSCHSGTATRGPDEVYRSEPAQGLVTSKDVQEKLKKLIEDSKGKSAQVSNVAVADNLVAIFATKADQLEPESMRLNVEIDGVTDSFQLGQLTYNFIQAVKDERAITYSDLESIMKELYIKDESVRNIDARPLPDPGFEGELSQKIFGG